MDRKIHSVTLEQTQPSFPVFLKAAFAYATGRADRARSILRGDQRLVAKDADGQLVFGIGGGVSMTVFTGNDKEAPHGVADNRPAGPNRGGLNL